MYTLNIIFHTHTHHIYIYNVCLCKQLQIYIYIYTFSHQNFRNMYEQIHIYMNLFIVLCMHTYIQSYIDISLDL